MQARHLARAASQASRNYYTMPRSQASSAESVTLGPDTNQALGIGQFAIDFMNGMGTPEDQVYKRCEQFHTDSVMCGLSAVALKTNAPNILRDEALSYSNPDGATVFGSPAKCQPEKAIAANSSAVREWDSNGTVFGYNEHLGDDHKAGEFGHNDFYPVAIAACQQRGLDGEAALRAMILSDEIRGRLAEVFSLKSYRIDHVVHGGIASAATYGAIMGATAEQIESAIGMLVAHYIPWRAIRAGKQLSDSKGASAAINTEAAVLSMRRSMAGFVGPKNIFANPESVFRQFEPTDQYPAEDLGLSPFDLVLTHSGTDFAHMGMHFKLGLYEHQSAGAIHGLISLLTKHPHLAEPGAVEHMLITAYQPAFGIIGDPAKRDPTTRQSADHSMVYIISTLLRKAQEGANAGITAENHAWKALMLSPYDYGPDALYDSVTRDLMTKMDFAHGGEEYDRKYPDGIPTSMIITDSKGDKYDSGFVMYPPGHARNTDHDLDGILDHKNGMLGDIAVADTAMCLDKLSGLRDKSAADIADIYNIEMKEQPPLEP